MEDDGVSRFTIAPPQHANIKIKAHADSLMSRKSLSIDDVVAVLKGR
jgi:hypothetical protein